MSQITITVSNQYFGDEKPFTFDAATISDLLEELIAQQDEKNMVPKTRSHKTGTLVVNFFPNASEPYEFEFDFDDHHINLNLSHYVMDGLIRDLQALLDGEITAVEPLVIITSGQVNIMQVTSD